ncbi:MAG: site-specific recombinase [Chthoniobacter sp.]|jgi:hypothetical protein|nr:site-specific recombinase [Chthoniobacter sp.]
MTTPLATVIAAPALAMSVATWRRVSGEEQAKEGHAGLQRQHDAITRIVTARGYRVIASFSVVHSGATVATTPEFGQLLALAQSGAIGAVIVSEVSRLIRPESWESLAVLDVFTKHHVLIIADGCEIDLSNPEGFLTGGLPILLAGHERLKLVQKISASKLVLKRQGRLASGENTLPFAVNYDWDASKYSYDPEKIWRVQEAFRLIDEDGLHNLAEIGRRVGIQRTSSLRVILANPIFGYGVRRYDKQRDMSVKRTGPAGKSYRPKVALPPEEVIEVKVIEDSAVSPERFERVQKVLEELRLNHVATLPLEKRVHLCTTYGRCGFCGQTLYISGNGKRDRATGRPLLWYCCRSQHPGKKGDLPRCSNSWTGEKKLDALLIAFATNVLTDRKLLTGLIGTSLQACSKVIRTFPQSGTEAGIAKLERQERKLIEMCKTDAITVDELKLERLKTREEIVRLRALASTPNQSPSQSLSLEEFARLVIKGALRVKRLNNPREQKALLEQVFADVFIRHESITAFRFHPSIIGSMGAQGEELSQTINLEKPFRITPEIPEGHKRCSKCGVILPKEAFPKVVSRCEPCFRADERMRRERAKGRLC